MNKVYFYFFLHPNCSGLEKGFKPVLLSLKQKGVLNIFQINDKSVDTDFSHQFKKPVFTSPPKSLKDFSGVFNLLNKF